MRYMQYLLGANWELNLDFRNFVLHFGEEPVIKYGGGGWRRSEFLPGNFYYIHGSEIPGGTFILIDITQSLCCFLFIPEFPPRTPI